MNTPTPELTIKTTLAKYDLFHASEPENYAGRLTQLLARMHHHRQRIEAALEYAGGTHNFDDIVAMTVRGDLLFWDLGETFMATEILHYPRARHFHVFLAGGDLTTLVNLHTDVIPFARALGCSKLTIAGRPGWVRALKSQGWEPAYTTLGKDI